MKKTLSMILLLALLAALWLCTLGAAEDVQTLQVLYDSNIRSGPGTDYEVAGRALEGDLLQSNGKTGEWYHIIFEDGEAYISDTRVQLITPPVAGEETPEPTATPEPVQTAGELRPSPTPDATIPAVVENTPAATPQPSAEPTPTATMTLAPELSLGPTTTPEENAHPLEGDLKPTTVILALAVVIATLVVVLLVSRARSNVELLEEEDGRLAVFAKMHVQPEKAIFIDITDYVVFKPRVYVRIYRSLIQKANAHIYIQVGDKVTEANMVCERNEKFSLTRVTIDWDAVTLTAR